MTDTITLMAHYASRKAMTIFSYVGWAETKGLNYLFRVISTPAIYVR